MKDLFASHTFIIFLLLPYNLKADPVNFDIALQQQVVEQQAAVEKAEESEEFESEVVEEKVEKEQDKEAKVTAKIVKEIAEKLSGDTDKTQEVKKDASVGKIEKTTEVKKKEAKELRNTLVNVFYEQPLPEGLFFVNQKNQIWLGTSLPLTGGVSMIGKDFSNGLNLVFNKLNRTGGIASSFMVKLHLLDDRNNIEKIRKNLNVIAKKTPFIIGCLGGETLKVLRKEIKNQELFLIFPAEGTEERKAENHYLNYLRAPIEAEISALLTFALKEKFKKKIAVMYESSSFGERGLKEAEKTLKEFGIEVSTKSSYPQNTVNINSAVKKIVANKPDAILCISQARPAYNFIRRTINEGLSNCLFLGTSELYPIQEIVRDSRGVQLILSSVVPDPFKSELSIVKQYREDMSKHYANRKLSTFSLEGYIAASIFSEALKSIVNMPTISNFLNFLDQLKNIEFGGLDLNFDPEIRTLSSPVWINQGSKLSWPIFTLKRQSKEVKI